jgi:hypothetical protein
MPQSSGGAAAGAEVEADDEPPQGSHETGAPVPWYQRAYNYVYDRTFGEWDAFRQKYADNGAKVGAAYGVVANNTIGIDVELAELPLNKLAVDLTDPNSDVFDTGEFRRRQTAALSALAKGVERDDPVLAQGVVGGAVLLVDTYMVVRGGQAALGEVAVTPRANPPSAPAMSEPPPDVAPEPVPGAAMAEEEAAAAADAGAAPEAAQATKPAWAQQGLDELAQFRKELGPIPGGGQADGGVLARLDVGGQSFYGVNAHGQPVTLRVNAITKTHAELHAFQQAANAGVKGGTGKLFVDAELCGACGQSGGVRSLARQLELEQLEIVTPSGVVTVVP